MDKPVTMTQANSRPSVHIRRQRRRAQCFTEPAIALDLVLIPGGTFTMGSPPEELNRYKSEGPQHGVTLSPFLMGRYPITQAQWKAIALRKDLQVERSLEANPSRFEGDDHPVERVSWDEAVEFCARFSQLTGHTYRLPSEAEWEYACRAGTTTPFHFGETITSDLANYRGTSGYGDGPTGVYQERTTPVNHFHSLANAFGLCDMHGNVFEWCQDYWHGSYENAPTDGSAWSSGSESGLRVTRGGSWYFNPRYCRSAYRFYYNPGVHYYFAFGFRVVCEARSR